MELNRFTAGAYATSSFILTEDPGAHVQGQPGPHSQELEAGPACAGDSLGPRGGGWGGGERGGLMMKLPLS